MVTIVAVAVRSRHSRAFFSNAAATSRSGRATSRVPVRGSRARAAVRRNSSALCGGDSEAQPASASSAEASELALHGEDLDRIFMRQLAAAHRVLQLDPEAGATADASLRRQRAAKHG